MSPLAAVEADIPGMNHLREKRIKRLRRHRRGRATLQGGPARPRLSVFRSNKHLWVQLIDDAAAKTLVSATDREVAKKGDSRMARAGLLGELVARKAGERGITAAVFDRGGYRYHGLVRAIAEAARARGLTI